MPQNKELEQGVSVPTKGRVTLAMMILGFAIPIIIAVITAYLNPEIPMQREALKIISRTFIWVWPSGIMMMVDPSDPVIALIILTISATVNACLYGLVGFAIAAIWQKIRVVSLRSKE